MLLLLSTSDTDLRSARASGPGHPGEHAERGTWRWANPARVEVTDELDALLAGVDLVVVRLLGGRQAWEAGLDALLAPSQPRPVVVLGGEQAPDAQLMALSTVPVGVAAQAHLYLAQGGPANLAQLHHFLSDTVLLTGHGFDPPVEMPTWGRLDGWEHPEDAANGLFAASTRTNSPFAPFRRAAAGGVQATVSMDRGSTGVDLITEVTVEACSCQPSRTRSRSATSRTCTRISRQSSPVILWHSTTSGWRAAICSAIFPCPRAGRTRTQAAMG